MWVQKNFPAEMRVSSVLLVADNVLTPEVMKEVRNQSTMASYRNKSSQRNHCNDRIILKGVICFILSFNEKLWCLDTFSRKMFCETEFVE